MNIILFETKAVEKLSPITLLRPAFDIFCGGTTLYEAVKKVFADHSVAYVVRDYLYAMAENKFGKVSVTVAPTLFINAAIAPDIIFLKTLQARVNAGKEFVFKKDGVVVAAFVAAPAKAVATVLEIADYINNLTISAEQIECALFTEPWHVITANQKIIVGNIEQLKIGLQQHASGVYVGKNVSIAKTALLDTSAGEIIIGNDTVVRDYTIVRGPVVVSNDCTIMSFSEIKAKCSIGPMSKIGGEVEALVVQGYVNKQHSGFVGCSYLGEWVNVGAGTATSNLKNTYGTVKIGGVDTGVQFLGSVIGDYSKTAVNSSIFTGKIIGVGSFAYGFVVRDVPSFTNSVFGKKLIECPLAVVEKMQTAQFARRKKTVLPADVELLANAFVVTKADRKLSKVKKSKLQL